MWIPNALYRKLPMAYTATGAALIPAFGLNAPSVLSAMLLIGAGTLTALWRYKHRQMPMDAALTLKQEWAQRRARRRERSLNIQ